MSLYRRAARKDDNHKAIVTALQGAGAFVESISGTGVPDLLVGFRGQTWLLELKRPGEFINANQALWLYEWKGKPVTVVRSPEEALKAIGAIR